MELHAGVFPRHRTEHDGGLDNVTASPASRPADFVDRIRAVVAEPESSSRNLIVDVLKQDSRVDVVAVCTTGKETVKAIESHHPDLLVLAVDFPDANAFDVINSIQHTALGGVVLVGTRRDVAVRAFDISALDYVVKPLRRRRIERALDRARQHLAREQTLSLIARLLEHLRPAHARPSARERMMVRTPTGRTFIDPAAIERVEADGNYVRVYLGGQSYRLRGGISAMEGRLGGLNFARVHRFWIVNLAFVREHRPKFGGYSDLVLKSGAIVPVGRDYRASLMERLSRPAPD
jgi:two-component system LytT family response regulator